MVWTMLKIENTDIYGWEAAIRGMRNPKNSWERMDSTYDPVDLGENDLKLAMQLANAGQVHGKFLRMITVTVDITAPLYWWKEFDTYKVGTVANSCSTMHKIQAKEFTMDDFSTEHLLEDSLFAFNNVIHELNRHRQNFLFLKDKKYWWQMIQLLPSSYNQKRTVQMNYAVLRQMYHSRHNHKLDEWRDLCKWVESLPYSELITDKGVE